MLCLIVIALFFMGFVLLTKAWDTSDFRPREHVFLSENDMPLVEHETTLSGYGREVRHSALPRSLSIRHDSPRFCWDHPHLIKHGQ